MNGCLADQHCVDRWPMRFRGYAQQLRHDTHRLHVETVARRDGLVIRNIFQDVADIARRTDRDRLAPIELR